MASILLLCIVTFVLCTGTQGDLSDLLIKVFANRSGKHLATAGGVKFYESELLQLKTQRNLADEFMRKCTDLAIKNVLQEMKGIKDEKDRKEFLPIMTRAQVDLEARLLKPRYFENGVKLADLVDHKLWLLQADRLGINLLDEHVRLMIQREMFNSVTRFTPYHAHQAYLAMSRMQGQTEGIVLKAVRDEFRVRIAQLAVMKAQIEAMDRRAPANTPEQLAELYASLKFASKQDFRIVPTPHQLWEFYTSNAATTDLRIVPVNALDFINDVAKPSESEINAFFADHKKKPSDPTSDTPGFQSPPKIKVQWVTADPDSAQYRRSSKAVLRMQTAPPAGLNPLASPLVTAAAYALNDRARRGILLQDTYDFRIQHTAGQEHTPLDFGMSPPPVTPYDGASLLSSDVYPSVLAYFAGKRPDAMASWVGAGALNGPGLLTSPLMYLQHGAYRSREEVAAGKAKDVREEVIAGLAEEARSRAPIFAKVAASAADSPFLALAELYTLTDVSRMREWNFEGRQSVQHRVLRKYFRYLPLEVVEDEIQSIVERRQAETWVNANMNELKRELEKKRAQGKQSAVEQILRLYSERMGLEHQSTKEFHTRYTIDKAKELEPLRKSFEKYWSNINKFEGRDLAPETKLKEGDFWKLFFSEGGEAFSVAGARYTAKPWPPTITPRNPGMIIRWSAEKGADEVVSTVASSLRGRDPTAPPPTIHLFDKAERPFLIWKTDDEQAKTPETLASIRPDVERAWKTRKARETALERAKQIAELFQKAADFDVLKTEAQKLNAEPIKLDGLAPLVMKQSSPTAVQVYTPYTLPKDQAFVLPRDDFASSLVKLGDLKEPIETGNKEIDDVNKNLFRVSEENKKVVQILTNKPRTMFYVAAPLPRNTSTFDFFMAFERAPSGDNNLLQKAQEEFAVRLRRELITQLRGRDFFIEEGEARKHFDSSEGS